MEFSSEQLFSFTSKTLADNTFAVVEFSGRTAISRCYRFDILLVTDKVDIDMDQVIRQPARFVIHRQGQQDLVINGVLASFQQQQAAAGRVFYRAVLVPRLWWLTLTHHNQVFLDKTVVQVVEAVLKEAGLGVDDYQFRLQSEYRKLPYICQYSETHLNFISRWLEREGIYYFFQQTPNGEKIIFTDSFMAHQPSQLGEELPFYQQSGMLDSERTEVAMSLICRHKSLPGMVRLRDYNYRKPSLEVEATAVVDPKGRGQVYIYGEHFRSPEEGKRLAKIRAQELLCRRVEFSGESTAAFLSPGYTFKLAGHYRRSFNQKYLAVSVDHHGSQAGNMTSGIREALGDLERKNFYRNQFVAIGAGVQFRPERLAGKPRITGALNARIDASGKGKYAELDEFGRYKVILPFDLSGRKDGKASAWLRMAQPYAGADHGMHFPLHKGTEVLLSFIEGNPDRPVIAAAVPNAEAPSPVTASDQTMAKVTTAGGNKIHIEDKDGSQRILLRTPTADTWMRAGAPNHPSAAGEASADKSEKDRSSTELWEGEAHSDGGAFAASNETQAFKDGFALSTEGHLQAIVGMDYQIQVGGISEKLVVGGENVQVIGESTEIILGGEFCCQAPESMSFTPLKISMAGVNNRISGNSNVIDGDRNQIAANRNEILAVANTLINVSNRLQTEVNQLNAQVNELAGEKNTLEGMVEKLQGEVTKLQGEVTKISEIETAIAANSTKLSENETAIAEVSTKLSETDTKLSAEIVNLASTVTNIAAETLLI